MKFRFLVWFIPALLGVCAHAQLEPTKHGSETPRGGSNAVNTATHALTSSSASTPEHETPPQGKNVASEGGADYTGHTDVTSVFSALEAANPGGTLILPAGTYLFNQNHTVPGNVTLQFMNGAQIATGNHGVSRITSISRTTANSANVRLNLTSLHARSSETDTTETIFAPNTFLAGNTVVLAGLTHVKNGNFMVISAGTNSTQFTVNIKGGTVRTVGDETGTVRFDSGSVTIAHFSTPLIGAVVNGNAICSGTQHYNGPYRIQAVADPQDIVFYDGRIGAVTETSGGCYVPYQLTINNAIIAGAGQQIVTPKSAVTFNGSPTIYVQWYGAFGDGVTDDWLPIQEALFWNPGGDITMPKRQASIHGGATVASTDYYVADTLQMSGNAQHIHGNVGETWDGGVKIAYPVPSMAGPGIEVSPICFGCTISNLNIYGGACGVTGIPGYYVMQPGVAGIGQDGISDAGPRPRIYEIQSSCWRRNGILLDGSYKSYAATIWGLGQPDYFHITDVFLNSNRGYGIVCIGHDCNGGVMDGGNNDLRSNMYGGVLDDGETTSTWKVNGENNADNLFGPGVTQTISRVIVERGVCTLVTAKPLVNGLGLANTWITVSGTEDSEGARNTDVSAAQALSVNVSTNTLTYPCPTASGGPARKGMVGTASTANIYALLGKTSAGYFNEVMQITGLYGGTAGGTLIDPYCESTNGPPAWNGATLILNGECELFSNNSPAVFEYANNGVLALNSRGIYMHSPTQGNLLLTLDNGRKSGSAAGQTGIHFRQNSKDQWSLQVNQMAPNRFSINDFTAGDNLFVFYAEPTGNVALTSPGKTGQMYLNQNSTGDVNFFHNSTKIDPDTGVTSNGLKDTAITGSTQCLQTSPNGTISGTGAPCAKGSGTISLGPVALPRSTIGPNTCAAAGGSPFAATGVTSSMVVVWGFASTPNSVTGYGASGGLVVNAYPTMNAVNIYVCNPTSQPIVPGPMTVNVRVLQ